MVRVDRRTSAIIGPGRSLTVPLEVEDPLRAGAQSSWSPRTSPLLPRHRSRVDGELGLAAAVASASSCSFELQPALQLAAAASASSQLQPPLGAGASHLSYPARCPERCPARASALLQLTLGALLTL